MGRCGLGRCIGAVPHGPTVHLRCSDLPTRSDAGSQRAPRPSNGGRVWVSAAVASGGGQDVRSQPVDRSLVDREGVVVEARAV